MPKRTSKTKLGRLFNKAWKVWSTYRRTNGKDFKDNIECFTCGARKNFKEMHLGHYMHGKADFSEIFTQPQCVYCNLRLHGNLGVYGEKLVSKYGLKEIQRLRREANQIQKYAIPYLEEIINKYKNEK